MLRSRYFGLATHTHSFAAALLGEGACGKLMRVYTNFDLKQLPPTHPLFALWGFVKGVVALPSSFFAVAAEQKSTRFLHLLLKEFKSCLSIYEKGITARKQLDMERKFLTFFLHHLPRRNSSTFSPNQKRDSPPSDLMGGYWHPAIPNTTHESPPTNPCRKHLLFHAGIFD